MNTQTDTTPTQVQNILAEATRLAWRQFADEIEDGHRVLHWSIRQNVVRVDLTQDGLVSRVSLWRCEYYSGGQGRADATVTPAEADSHAQRLLGWVREYGDPWHNERG